MQFAAQALAAGAVAVVGEKAAPPANWPARPIFRSPMRGRACHWRRRRLFPRQPGKIVAVTGTSGKTSVADFTRQIFDVCGFAAASLGTIGVVKPGGAVYGSLTTPDPVTLHKTLDALAGEGVTHLAMEASSHGLDQRRLDGVRAHRRRLHQSVARSSRLSRQSRRLSRRQAAAVHANCCKPGQTAVVAADGDHAGQVIAACRARGLNLFTVGAKGDGLRLKEARAEGFALRLDLVFAGRDIAVKLPLAGLFQAENALVAAGLALAAGAPAGKSLRRARNSARRAGAAGARRRPRRRAGLRRLRPQARRAGKGAGRPAAFRQNGASSSSSAAAATATRASGRSWARSRQRGADAVIVTDDNPRSEDAGSIRAQILAAAPGAREIGDRARAIRAGVAHARRGRPAAHRRQGP